MVWYALAYGVASVTWSQPQTGVAAEIIVPSVLRALLWPVAVGITAWATGYLVGPGICHPPASWDQVEGFPAMSMGPPGRQ